VVSVGLDRRVIVHDVEDPPETWAWSDYEDYLNTCASARPPRPGPARGRGRLAVHLRARRRRARGPREARHPGRHQRPPVERGRPLRPRRRRLRARALLRRRAAGSSAGEARVGGAAKRMVIDPASAVARARGLLRRTRVVGLADAGRWRALRRGRAPARHVGDQRRGDGDAPGGAELLRPRVPHRARRDGGRRGDVGPSPTRRTAATGWPCTHGRRDRGHARRRPHPRPRGLAGRLLRTFGPDSDSLYMGAAFHPTLPLLATVDFYGELLLYDHEAGRVVWREDMGFGPGHHGRLQPVRPLARGGRLPLARTCAPLGDDGSPPRRARRAATAASSRASRSRARPAARGVGRRRARRARSRRRSLRGHAPIRGTPPMELSNGVAASPDGRVALRRVARSVAARVRPRVGRAESRRARARARRQERARLGVRASRRDRRLRSHGDDLVADDLTVRLPPVRSPTRASPACAARRSASTRARSTASCRAWTAAPGGSSGTARRPTRERGTLSDPRTGQGFVFVELYVEEPAYYVRIFRDALGFEVVRDEGDFVELRSERGMVLLNAFEEPIPGTPSSTTGSARAAWASRSASSPTT
jgi:hypothetical protein